MKYITLVLLFFMSLAGSQSSLAAPTLDDMFKAVKTNDVRELRTFLEQGMDPDSTNQQGYSVLMEAAREGHVEVIALLLDRKAKVNQRNAVGETALMLAAFKGNVEAVRLLHGRGAEINSAGWTALHYAAFQGQTGAAKYLLDNKAQVDARAPNGITPLMAGVRNGHTTSSSSCSPNAPTPMRRTMPGVQRSNGPSRAAIRTWLSC